MTNRLDNETSPYLLQHAENPVDWYPWGEQALTLAHETDKPIFLSVGYAACHWCHVMAHESFEDPEIAAIMNELYINIKVDREERPDVDSLYMEAVVAMTGQGGWPMSVFLTPEGNPFYGGTYFPPIPRYNIPSFREVLLHIARMWRENRNNLIETGSRLTQHLVKTVSLQPDQDTLDPASMDQAAENLLRSFDWNNGGWGGAPKFPQATTIDFLLRRHFRLGDRLALDLATRTLKHMAAGGMYDQLGGGFHRYAVDANWLVPHFEKMLYDNALLARIYLHAWQITGEEIFRKVTEETVGFLLREMRSAEGGFYSSLDADSEGEEGRYYVWTPDEIREVLLDSTIAEVFITAYGVSDGGNFEGRTILFRPMDDEAIAQQFQLSPEETTRHLSEARALLNARREARIRPATDDKVLTAWNGLTLITLAEAARALDREDYLSAAQSLASFLLDNLFLDGRLTRSWRVGRARYDAYLEDHAALGLGLLSLYQTDFNPKWYQAAVERAEEILAHFVDPEGGFFDTRDDHEPLIARPKSIHDNPTPSGNTLACTLLLELGALTGKEKYSIPAESAIRAMGHRAAASPTAFAGWLLNMDFSLGPTLQLALLGPPSDKRMDELARVASQQYLPRLVVAAGEPGTPYAPSLLEGRAMVNGLPTAYLCQGFTCKLPTNSPQELNDQLEETLKREHLR
ncbi:MAG TPA: thioredoxin domain-containing protein [Anaerolineae bacterium]|nr:thioredoxin domain-containing protein [Anaerolineae bacterium]